MSSHSWSDWIPSIPEPIGKLLGWYALMALIYSAIKNRERIIKQGWFILLLGIGLIGICTRREKILYFTFLELLKSHMLSTSSEVKIYFKIFEAIGETTTGLTSQKARKHLINATAKAELAVFHIWNIEGRI